jgi:glycosyltransferase involved in cell wall biosynthesis
MQYNFSHWPKLPKVSCKCITYGRPELLNEAVQSFLTQDYIGEKELVILNDHADSYYETDIPNIKIINVSARIPSIGEKQNLCVSHCDGDIICPWDDDDISLSHRISFSLQEMKNRKYFKGDKFWFTNHERLYDKPEKNSAHAMSAYCRELFLDVGGYSHIHSGHDISLEVKFKERKVWSECKLSDKEVYYIYRFNNAGNYNLSGYGKGQGHKESEEFVNKKRITGKFVLKPAYRLDYESMIAAKLKESCI